MKHCAISREDLQVYRETARKQTQQQQARQHQAGRDAWCAVDRAVEILTRQFGATRIMLFGSLARDDLFHAHSDVDLAVSGIAEEQYCRAVGVLQGVSPGIAIDLVRLEEASTTLLETIMHEGRVLL